MVVASRGGRADGHRTLVECGLANVSALERGRIAFVVRPRVGGLPGYQSFAFVLDAESGAHRRIAVGKKRMPAPGSSEREWAFVDRVAARHEEVVGDLGPSTYVTKTRGVRHRPAARVIGEGRYALIAHGTHAHLCYALDDLDAEEVVEPLHVRPRGSLIVAVFNPIAKWSREAVVRHGGDPDDASPFGEPTLFDEDLQDRFGKKRFLPLDPELLDHEGTELVLIGAERDLRPELAAAISMKSDA
jgi:hypothetical protein